MLLSDVNLFGPKRCKWEKKSWHNKMQILTMWLPILKSIYSFINMFTWLNKVKIENIFKKFSKNESNYTNLYANLYQKEHIDEDKTRSKNGSLVLELWIYLCVLVHLVQILIKPLIVQTLCYLHFLLKVIYNRITMVKVFIYRKLIISF